MRFVATLNDQSFINVPADRMEVRENLLWVWNGKNLVAMVEITAIICARLSEGGTNGSK